MNKTRSCSLNFALIPLFLSLSFLYSPLHSQNTYCEAGDILVVDIESEAAAGDWQFQTSTAGYTGTGYHYWNGPNYSGSPGNGLMSYTINITNPGTYRFRWRSRIGLGTKQSEHNDAWLRLPDADDFYGYKAGTNSTVYPKGSGKTPTPNGAGAGGWFKVYMNSLNAWVWDARTSDNDAHQIYAVFNTAGLYTVEISGRSTGYILDRFMLYQESSWSFNNAQNASVSTINCNSFYQDLDNDGYGNPAVTSSTAQAGYVNVAGDCNDNLASINPGALEICGNATDENCDGITATADTWYQDADNDGFGNAAVSQNVCGQPTGYVADNTDCNDGAANAYPGAIEILGDGIDNNCNGQTDETGIINVFNLINATDETVIQVLNDGDVIGMNNLPSTDLNINVTTNQSVGSIVFTLTGAETQNTNENNAPYALFGDAGGNYNVWNPTMGNYVLTADAYSGVGGGGTLEGSVTINFTIQPTVVSFPVNWLSFEAKETAGQVKLTWETASEQNSSHFVVERSTINAPFKAIGQVEAAGNISQVSSYEMVDATPPAGTHHYRIKQIDFDGQFSYSSMVEIKFKGLEVLRLFPNPSTTGAPLFLQGSFPQIKDVKLSLISSTGKLVWQKDHFLLNNQGAELSIPTLSSGIYLLRVQSPDGIRVLKLMIGG